MSSLKDLKHNKIDSCKGKNILLCQNLYSLSLFCLWPFQSDAFLQSRKKRALHHALGLFIYVMFFLFLVTEFMELVHVWGNLEDMTTNMSVTCLYTIGILKIYTFFGCRQKLKDLISGISTIEQNILKYQSEEITSIFHACVRRARRRTYEFWTLTASTILVFFVIPPIEYKFSTTYHRIFNNGTEFWSYKRPMIFSSWFPFDKFAVPNYLAAYFYQVMMGTIGASYQAIWDTFIVSMMIHAIGQLQILQKMMEQMTPKSVENKFIFKGELNTKKEELIVENIVHQKLVHCVNHHRYIIGYVQNLNDIISPLMMVYFMVCSLMLCAIGFQATLYGFSIRLCFMVEYLIAMMVQLFLFYWHGNEVMHESEKLVDASYSCCWYNASASIKRSLWIMRKRMQTPVCFSVGPFYTMTLQTFIMILRASYSYFALLRQVQESHPQGQ